MCVRLQDEKELEEELEGMEEKAAEALAALESFYDADVVHANDRTQVALKHDMAFILYSAQAQAQPQPQPHHFARHLLFAVQAEMRHTEVRLAGVRARIQALELANQASRKDVIAMGERRESARLEERGNPTTISGVLHGGRALGRCAADSRGGMAASRNWIQVRIRCPTPIPGHQMRDQCT